MKRSKGPVNFATATLLLGLVAGLLLMSTKLRQEPLSRNIVLALYVPEHAEALAPAAWQELWDAGVRMVTVPPGERLSDDAASLQMTPLYLLTQAAYVLVDEAGAADAAAFFVQNRLPRGYALPQGVHLGIVDMAAADGYRALSGYAGRFFRVYFPEPHLNVNEYMIAVRERQADVLIFTLRPESDDIEGATRFIAKVAGGVQRDGHALGDTPFLPPAYRVASLLKLLQILALGAAVSYLPRYIRPSIGRSRLPFYAAAACGAAFLMTGEGGRAALSQVLALGSAVVYPLIGILSVVGAADSSPKPWLWFLRVCGWTALGGVAVAGFTSDYLFQMRIFQFSGVKAAYLLPLTVAYVFTLRAIALRGLRTRRKVAQVAVFSVVFWLSVAFLVIRSGNAPIVAVPESEIALREFLFRLFWVRPRTKEFLLHPLLLAGLYLMRSGRQIPGRFAVLLASVGQLSIVNTFAHAHHPVIVSCLRSGLGIALGAATFILCRYAGDVAVMLGGRNRRG